MLIDFALSSQCEINWKIIQTAHRVAKLTSLMSTNKLCREFISMRNLFSGEEFSHRVGLSNEIVYLSFLPMCYHQKSISCVVSSRMKGAWSYLGEISSSFSSYFPSALLCSVWWRKCNFNLLFIGDISSHIIALFCDIANLSAPYSSLLGHRIFKLCEDEFTLNFSSSVFTLHIEE